MGNGILSQDPRTMTRESRMAYLDALAREQGIEHEKSNRTRRNEDKKRCPNCKGEAGKWEGRGNCWLTACARGPFGKPCGCHHALSGMGIIGQEGWVDKKPDIDPMWQALRNERRVVCDVRQVC